MTTYSIFSDSLSINASADEGEGISVGTEFYVTANASVTAIRYPHALNNGGTVARIAGIYEVINESTGLLVAGPFTMGEGSPGSWNTFQLPTPLPLVPDTRYRVVVHHPEGKITPTHNTFSSSIFVRGPLVAPNSAGAIGNDQGSFTYSSDLAFTTSSFSNAAYYSDVVVSDNVAESVITVWDGAKELDVASVGPQGPRGLQGIRGSKWYISSAETSDYFNVTGMIQGDIFLYPTSRDIFQYNGTAWIYSGALGA